MFVLVFDGVVRLFSRYRGNPSVEAKLIIMNAYR